MSRPHWAIWFLYLGTSTLVAQAGPPPPAPDSKPDLALSPTATLKLAEGANGLDLHPQKPWHIELTYDQFDEDGDNVHSGTIEEFYAGPKKYKRILQSDTLTQTDVATAAGLFRAGDQRWESPTQLQVEQETLQPFYLADDDPKTTKLEALQWSVGKTALSCVGLSSKEVHMITVSGLTKLCFDPGTTRLRYTRGRGWDETTYNDFAEFDGREVARRITVTHVGKPFLKIHIEKLETYSPAGEEDFAPPVGSTQLQGRIKLPAAMLRLTYPGDLGGSGGDNGVVQVRFVMGKDGKVIEAAVIAGPKGLQKKAVAAMYGCRFRPFLILGEPVEVESEMEFSYFNMRQH